MDILTNIINLFGLETKLFIAQIVNFAILLYILKKFLYKPIAQTLKERQAKIKQGLQDAENAKQALKTADIQKIEILRNARKDADKMIEITKQSVQSIRQQVMDDSKKQAKEIIESAKKNAEAEYEAASKKIGVMSVDLSKSIVSKILSELFTEEDKNAVLVRAVEKLESSKYGKATN
ncbi:MAG: F0F1 ATP synthase subunit B [Elusimicrobia bacterium]|nr:F0F1 ATP synthase subunit B [Elusimicrobiota bacterium]